MLYHPFKAGDVLKRRGNCFPNTLFTVLSAPIEKQTMTVVMFDVADRYVANDTYAVSWAGRYIDGAVPEMMEPICASCGRGREYHTRGACLFASTKYSEATMPPEIFCKLAPNPLGDIRFGPWITMTEDLSLFLHRLHPRIVK